MLIGSRLGLIAGAPQATIAFVASYVDATNGTTWTFTAASLGDAATNRVILVPVVNTFGSAPTTNASVTIGGVSATQITRAGSGADDANSNTTVELWLASVPTGTTGDIVVTSNSAAVNNCGIGVFRSTGISTTAHHTAASADAADPMTISLNIPAGGVALACGADWSTSTYTWTNLTEAYDQAIEGAISHSGASDFFATAQTGLTITCDPSNAVSNGTMIGASFPSA